MISALLSPILAAKTARNLEILACWAAKELNLTSAILSDRIQDVDCVWHAVLQNHAAIDFLLLAQDHRCQDFDENIQNQYIKAFKICRVELRNYSLMMGWIYYEASLEVWECGYRIC